MHTGETPTSVTLQTELVEHLKGVLADLHAADTVELLQTHISYVLLAGGQVSCFCHSLVPVSKT